MWLIPFVIASALLIVAVVVCVWLVAKRGELPALKRDLADSQSKVKASQDDIYRLHQERGEVDRKLAVAQQVQEQTREQFDKAQKDLREAFDSLAGKALKEANGQFLQLAKKSFEGEQKDAAMQLEQRKAAIGKMLDPLKESLSEYKKTIQAIETERKQDKGTLTEQIERLSGLTSSLDRSLRHPGSRGQWGQFTLRRVAELAGMSLHCDFFEQVSRQTGEGRLQPDMVVKLPNDRTIVVDAKTPFDSYQKATEAQSEGERQGLLQSHAQAVEGHVKQLAGKQYSQQFDASPDFVVMFLPAESMLYAALGARPELIDAAMDRGVVIATPSILVAMLKAVAVGWREQRLAENAKKISDLGRELHRRLVTLIEHYTRLGNALDSTITHYNNLGNSLDTRVLPQAGKFAELGADSPKELPPQVRQIEKRPRPEIKVVVDEAAHRQPRIADV